MEELMPGTTLDLSRMVVRTESRPWNLARYEARKAAKAAKQAVREEKRKAKMQQRNESIHKMVFERLDKELRKTDLTLVQTGQVAGTDGLPKDVYPYTAHVAKVIRKFDLPDKFFYAHVHDESSWTAHFTINREEDPVTHVERPVSISVIIVR